jgi:hypothetical protein
MSGAMQRDDFTHFLGRQLGLGTILFESRIQLLTKLLNLYPQ